MEKNIILTEEDALHFTHALQLLQTSIVKLNQVVDEMIPEELLRKGLPDYLADCGRNLELIHKFKVTFTCKSQNMNIKTSIESAVFRCFRNVIALFLKYTSPSVILINLKASKNILQLHVNIKTNNNILGIPKEVVKNEVERIQTILNPLHGKLINSIHRTRNKKIEIQVPL